MVIMGLLFPLMSQELYPVDGVMFVVSQLIISQQLVFWSRHVTDVGFKLVYLC